MAKAAWDAAALHGVPCRARMCSQLVFLDLFVRPLFNAAAILYPGAKQRLSAIQECREACKAGLRAHGKGQRLSAVESTRSRRSGGT